MGSKAASRSVTLWWEPPRSAEQVLVRGYALSYGEEEESSSRRVILEGVNTNAFTVEDLSESSSGGSVELLYYPSLSHQNQIPLTCSR